ncbi:MAG: ABC transporter ATP-binding protein [Actinomycetota bacterium]
MNLLEIRNLTKEFTAPGSGIFNRNKRKVHAVSDVSLTLAEGETLGLVGESGCGKSTLGRTLLKLYEPTSGQIIYSGQDITNLSPREMKPLRSQMQIIFQDPYSSLNPRHTVGEIVGASLRIHRKNSKSSEKLEIQQLMERVGLNPEHINRYPHEFSGGQRQRIGIARAIALRPKFIVCDEPVSALDVSIQAQVINLLDDLKRDFGLSYIFIAHNLSVVQHISDRVAVMYLGKVVEIAQTRDLYTHSKHPYTRALLSAIPIPDPEKERTRKQILLQGEIPSSTNPPSGCVFNTRCWKAQEKCRTLEPKLARIGASEVACHFPED